MGSLAVNRSTDYALIQECRLSVHLLFYCELDGWFNAIEVVHEWGDESLGKGCESVISIVLPEAWGQEKHSKALSSTVSITKLATTTDTGDPIVVSCTCMYTFPLKDRNVASRHRVKRSVMSSMLSLVCSRREHYSSVCDGPLRQQDLLGHK